MDLLKFIQKLIELFSTKSTPVIPKPQKEPTPVQDRTPEAIEQPRRAAMKGATLRAKNESKRIKSELLRLKDKNQGLFSLITELADWIDTSFNKNTIITMIYRTDAEQAQLYRQSEKYKKKPFKSPHQFWHAIDLRTWIYTEEEIEKIVKYLNDKHNGTNYYKWSAKAHQIKGNAMHFHIQYIKS